MNKLPAAILIGAQILKDYAVGESIEARFTAIITPAHLASGCYMCTTEDEEFRAAVGGLILSYPTDSPEQDRITIEMHGLQQVTMILQAAQLGMSIGDVPDRPEGFEPIGLLGLWRERPR